MAARKKRVPPGAQEESAPSAQTSRPPSLLGEGPKPVKEWPGLFQVFANSDGTRYVQMAPELEMRYFHLERRLPISDDSAMPFLAALALMDSVLEMPIIADLREGAFAKLADLRAAETKAFTLFAWKLLEGLRAGFGPELTTLFNHGASRVERTKAAAKVSERVSNYLKKHAAGQSGPSSRNSGFAMVTLESGEKVEAAIPWLAIHFTREIVTDTGELPTKAFVRLYVLYHCNMHPGPSDRQWQNIWREAGLSNLPRYSPAERQRGEVRASRR